MPAPFKQSMLGLTRDAGADKLRPKFVDRYTLRAAPCDSTMQRFSGKTIVPAATVDADEKSFENGAINLRS